MNSALRLFPRRLSCTLALASLASLSFGLPGGGTEPHEPLNILFIVSDQHNARALGYAGNGYGGASVSMTPELDQLAQEGIRFETALVPQPQCSPTRYSYFTGLWPHDHGLRWNGIWEPRGVATLPEMARSAGYETAVIGKHHMHWLDQTPITEDFGFDHITSMRDYVSFVVNNGPGSWTRPGNFFGMPNLPSGLAFYTGFTSNANEYHPDGFFASQTIEYLEARAADQKPFLCYLMFLGPHTPLTPTGPAHPENWAQRFHPFTDLDLPPNKDRIATTQRLALSQNIFGGITDNEWKEILSYYYGLIAQIDFNIGRVLDRLEQLGLDENTLVIYTADHGEMASEMGVWQKGTGSYDATTRVPLILKLPGVIPPDQVSSDLTTTLDLIPTIFELTGIPIGDEDRSKLGGESLVDILLGDSPPDWRTEVFGEFGSTAVSNIGRTRMVRTATHKYSFDERFDEEEFYDLVNDEYEITNLINDPDPQVQAKIAELRGYLDTWWNNELGHAPQYLTSGEPNQPPSQAAYPVPATGMTNVARNVDPTWLPSTAAESQRVFIGRNASSLSLFRELEGTETTFNPGTLMGGQDFFWRVDQLNQNGTTPGPVWFFQAAPGNAVAPGLTSAPTPAHRGTGVGLAPRLTWKSGKGARAQTLFFGVKGDLRRLAKLTARVTEFQPGRLLANTTYEWRVNSIRPTGETEGDVWSFTTNANGLPRSTTPIQPRHLEDGVAAQAGGSLSWLPLPGQQIEYDVYFGQTFPLDFQGRQTSTTFDHGVLGSDETYYWRVDAANHRGLTPGFTWRFSTAP